MRRVEKTNVDITHKDTVIRGPTMETNQLERSAPKGIPPINTNMYMLIILPRSSGGIVVTKIVFAVE